MSQKDWSVHWPMVILAYLTLFCLGLLDNARGPFFQDIIVDLKLSDTQASFFFAVTSSMGFIMGRLVPRYVVRWGVVPVVRLGQLFMGCGFASLALANSLSTLIATAGLFGVGFGILNVAQNLLLLEGATGSIRRRLFSGLHGMYAASSLISPLVAAFLFRQGVGWRTAFVGFAAVTLVSFIYSLLVRPPAGAEPLAPLGTTTPNSHDSKESYGAIAGVLSFYVLAELVVSTRISLYLRREFNYSPDDASIVLALFFALLLLGRLVLLFVPLRQGSLKIIEWSLMASIVAYGLGLWVHPTLFALCGLTMSPIFALVLDLIAELYPKTSVKAISHCVAVSCLYIVSMHFIMGLLTDWIGIHWAMYFGGAALIVSLVLVYRVRAQHKGRA